MQDGASKSPRAAQACDACKRRKVRCNGGDRCQQCKHFDLRCVYTPIKRGRPRKNAAARGAVIEEYRRGTSSDGSNNVSQQRPLTSPTSVRPDNSTTTGSPPAAPVMLPSMLLHPDPGYFLDLLPDYMTYVYPVNPVITASEIRICVDQLHTSREAACFLYAFAAVTINLTRTDQVQFAPDIRDQITTLLHRCLDNKESMGLDAQPSLLRVYTNIFIQICLMALRKIGLGFFYLREAISMLHLMQVENAEIMAGLEPAERARRQRAYWECFIHERFTALTDYKPTCLRLLPDLPDHDSTLSPEIEHGWNHIIQTFLLVDDDFINFWIGDRTRITAEWIEEKHRQLEDDQWNMEVSILSATQQADLIITRQWLRTLVWQMAMSNVLLSSEATTESLSLTLPLRLSTQLRLFLMRLSHDAVGIHGSGILNKLFEITDTIADVVIHLPEASREDTLQRVDDILFLKRFIFSFPRIETMHRRILKQKFERMKEKYPEMEEIEILVSSPLSLTSSM
jgi:Fungal Zn(2)-Cys(6) binuclear cluster domain